MKYAAILLAAFAVICSNALAATPEEGERTFRCSSIVRDGPNKLRVDSLSVDAHDHFEALSMCMERLRAPPKRRDGISRVEFAMLPYRD